MAKKTKRKKQASPAALKVVFRVLSEEDWGKIFSIPWPPATRKAMGILFAENGSCKAGPALDGAWSRAMQINRNFIKHDYPYRVRSFDLPQAQQPKAGEPGSGYHVYTQELRLCCDVTW